MENEIPKIIHQTWKNNNIPKRWRISQKMWKKLHPSWQYVFWTDKSIEKYMRLNHRKFYKQWKEYPYHIQRVDAVRYFILKDFGGVYSDLDIVPRVPIDSYIEGASVEAMFVPSANMNDCFTNSFMISKKGASIWDRVIEEMKLERDTKWWKQGKHITVLWSTGPMCLTNAIFKHDKVLGYLPVKLFHAKNANEIPEITKMSDILKEKSVLVNVQGSSWHEFDSKFFNWLNKYKFHINVVILLYVLYLFVKKNFL